MTIPSCAMREARSDAKTFGNDGTDRLRGALLQYSGSEGRSLQRRNCSIRSRHTPVGGKSERGIDGATVGWRPTWLAANTRFLEAGPKAPAIEILDDDGPRQAVGCQGRSHGMQRRAYRGQANVYSLKRSPSGGCQIRARIRDEGRPARAKPSSCPDKRPANDPLRSRRHARP